MPLCAHESQSPARMVQCCEMSVCRFISFHYFCFLSFLSPKHTIHWNWRIGHCGWWCCAQLRLGTGWCCFGSRWWETPGLEVWRIRNQSWLLVTSLTLVETIRGPGGAQKDKNERLGFLANRILDKKKWRTTQPVRNNHMCASQRPWNACEYTRHIYLHVFP